MNITPRFVTWGCPACNPQFVKEECLSNGKYCAPNHIKDDFNRYDGKNIILEDLRQTCLHREMVKQESEPKWWDYMKEVHSECFGFISEQCSKNAHKTLGLSFDTTMKCVKESFQGSDFSQAENTIMKENAVQWKEYGTLYWPSVTINRVTFRGDITPENIVEDICANLAVKP